MVFFEGGLTPLEANRTQGWGILIKKHYLQRGRGQEAPPPPIEWRLEPLERKGRNHLEDGETPGYSGYWTRGCGEG